jgi:hypothetical protein
MRILAYGYSADSIDEYLWISPSHPLYYLFFRSIELHRLMIKYFGKSDESTSLENLKQFCQAIVNI